MLKPLALLLLLPPVPALLLIALGAWLLRRHARLGGALIALGLAGAWLGASIGSAQWMMRHLVEAAPALDQLSITALQQRSRAQGDVAVLVLGAGIRDDVPETHGPNLKRLTLERLRYGVWLARRLDAPLGFTGGVGWVERGRHLPEAVVAQSVARDEFQYPLRWAENRSRDTRENATFGLPLLKAAGVHKVIVVTNAQHMPRALQNFREVARSLGGIDIVAAPMGLIADGMSEALDWCPDGEGLSSVRYVIYEWLARLAGH